MSVNRYGKVLLFHIDGLDALEPHLRASGGKDDFPTNNLFGGVSDQLQSPGERNQFSGEAIGRLRKLETKCPRFLWQGQCEI